MDQALVAALATPGWLECLQGGGWDSMNLIACYCEKGDREASGKFMCMRRGTWFSASY